MQSIDCNTGGRRRSLSEGSGTTGSGEVGTLCDNFEMRRNYVPQLASQRRKRITSAPPVRSITTVQPTAQASSSSNYQGLTMAPPSPLQRRRSFSAVQQQFPSKAEMLKEIFTVYPAPQPRPASKWKNRPSSAVTLRVGKIPNLRKTNPWV